MSHKLYYRGFTCIAEIDFEHNLVIGEIIDMDKNTKISSVSVVDFRNKFEENVDTYYRNQSKQDNKKEIQYVYVLSQIRNSYEDKILGVYRNLHGAMNYLSIDEDDWTKCYDWWYQMDKDLKIVKQELK